jgi:hypothetical protein
MTKAEKPVEKSKSRGGTTEKSKQKLLGGWRTEHSGEGEAGY